MAGEIAGRGKRLMLVHGSNPERIGWLADELRRSCQLTTFTCSKEPDLPLVEAAVALARDQGVDAVVAIGGGSVIDLGKAVAGLAGSTGSVLDYLEVVGLGKPIEADPLPFIALPTTSGTGAEATRNAVIDVPEKKRKVSLRDRRMLPELVIVDPALTDDCPRSVTLSSGLDAITQLIEPYLSVKANAFTDGLVDRALPDALTAIRVLAEREDARARDAMAWASLSSGMALANAGLGAVHGFAGVIGGATGAPHGEICASLLAASLHVNREAAIAASMSLERIDEIQAMLARAFNDQSGNDGFAKLGRWITANGVRGITELGVPRSRFETMAEASRVSSSMRGNMVELSNSQLVDILERSA
ncbi:iron-containing alcohol dehydrogenase [Pseudohoeflea suaedae]|uniref:Iron-containing alcohol dehydrogenase n=2 Tax=Pseudohoeflea suaedae TaxID=877384 RepID=A0A4R5PS55_9HYPH|nr:iron-containing alcohol dehydrogenase [Pseudohoeflea suaedae]